MELGQLSDFRGEGEDAWYTLFVHALNWKFRGDCVRMSVPSDIINLPRCCASQCSVWVSFISHCSMPSGSWVPQDKAQERTDCFQWACLLRKRTFVRLTTNFFSKSIPTTVYQTFLFVSDSIKLGKACSSNVHCVLRTKTEIICITGYAIHVNRYRHISTRP